MSKHRAEEEEPPEKEPARSGSIPGPTYENTNADEEYVPPHAVEFREERGSADADR